MDSSDERHDVAMRAEGRDLACEAILRSGFGERETHVGDRAIAQLRKQHEETPETPNTPPLAATPQPASRSRRRGAWWIAVAATAAAVVAFVSWRSLPVREVDRNRREVAEYPTPVASGSYEVAGGGPIRREATLTTEEKEAEVVLGGYCTVKIKPNSKAKIEGSEGNECIVLEQGGVVSKVDRGVGEYSVRTTLGTVSVTGTEFEVSVLEEKGIDGMNIKQLLVRVIAGSVLVSGVTMDTTVKAGEQRVYTTSAAKAPVPSPQAQAKALALIKEIYGKEYEAATTPEKKEALAGTLLALARETKALPDRYAILRVARTLSIAAGSPVCFQAVDEMANGFQIDGLDMKVKVLPHCGAKATAERCRAIAQTGIALVHQALAEDRHALAQEVIGATSAAARKSKDVTLVNQAGDLGKKIEAVVKAYAEVKVAKADLAANAADPAANLTVGKYYCFLKGDWGKGLPLLARSSDPTLKPLADKELQGVTAAVDQLALGDGWWALAESDPAKDEIRRHAAVWYHKALPGLTGLKKLRVAKRLEEVPAAGAVAAVSKEVAVATPARPSPIQRPPRKPKLSKELTINLPGGVKMEFVLIPAGEFMMGSTEAEQAAAINHPEVHDRFWTDKVPSEGPQHKVKVSKPFYLGKYEVTQAQWESVMGSNPSEFPGPQNPVDKVSWDDVQAFSAKLNAEFQRKGMRFGLPTEAAWEYACRAGTTTAYSFGNNSAMLAQHGWSSKNSERRSHPVGQGKPNAWGLYDMHGNVWEWCSDWHAKDYYSKSPPVDPVGPPTGSHRVFRGGSWSHPPRHCRAAYRRGDLPPGESRRDLGFRLALVSIKEIGRSGSVEAPESTGHLAELFARIEARDLPKGYKGAAHQEYVDRRKAGLTGEQRSRIGRLWKEKQKLHPDMPDRGASFVKIMEYVAVTTPNPSGGVAPEKPQLPIALKKVLRLHYSFDKDEGDRVLDQSGKGHHGKVAGPKWVADARGPDNGAYVFDGVDDVIVLPNTAMGNAPALTLCMWAKLPRYDRNDRKSWPALIGSYYGNEHRNTSIGISRHKGKFRTEITTDRRTFPLYEGSLPIPWDTWFHVALVYDGATLTEYLNGVRGASMEASGNMATPTELFLGRDHTAYDAIRGTLDEVMIFGAALTEEQIKMLFEGQGVKE